MRRLRHFILTSLLACACDSPPSSRRGDVAEAESSPSQPDKLPPILAPYPRAAWRVGNLAELGDVVEWVSHILIRFDRAPSNEVSFNLHDWYSVTPPPERTRDEALRLARDVAEKARLSPSSFADLAREYSEDITTAEAGGSLGGMPMGQFIYWPQVIDTLAAIEPGQTSEVVETGYGFHVFLRTAPPPEQRVSGSHIVIGHHQGGWLKYVGTGEAPTRSRPDALQLATEVYASAKRDPSAFERLVEQFSEHRTKTQGGDFGTFSNHEPTWLSRQVEVLGKLAVGDVAPPIDTPWGFEVLKRTPNRERVRYAANGIWLAFDPSAPIEKPNSRASVFAKATAIADSVAGDGPRFAQVQKDICCTFQPQWEEGQETPALTAMLKTLAIGEVARTPVQSDFYYVVAQRVEPSPPAPQRILFNIPMPDKIDLGYHVSALSATVAEEELKAATAKAIASIALSGDLAARLLRLRDQKGRFDDTKLPDDNREAFQAFMLAVDELLGSERYAQYLDIVRQQFTDYVMSPDPRHSGIPERCCG
jgi:hypothetical protein